MRENITTIDLEVDAEMLESLTKCATLDLTQSLDETSLTVFQDAPKGTMEELEAAIGKAWINHVILETLQAAIDNNLVSTAD